MTVTNHLKGHHQANRSIRPTHEPRQQPASAPSLRSHSISDSVVATRFIANMADDAEALHAAELKKKRQFRKFSYRGVDLEDLLDKSSEEVPK